MPDTPVVWERAPAEEDGSPTGCRYSSLRSLRGVDVVGSAAEILRLAPAVSQSVDSKRRPTTPKVDTDNIITGQNIKYQTDVGTRSAYRICR